MAGAPASGVQDADVEPASQRFWIVDGIVLNHLAVRKAASVERDAQILDAMRLRAPRRKLENVLRPRQGFGDEAFSVMIAPQEEYWNAAIREASQLPVEEESDRGVLPLAVENVAGDHDERNALLQRLRDKVFECASARLGEARGNVLVLLGKAEKRAAKMKISGVQEAEVHPGNSKKAFCAARRSRPQPPASAASGNRGGRRPRERSGAPWLGTHWERDSAHASSSLAIDPGAARVTLAARPRGGQFASWQETARTCRPPPDRA